MNTLELAKTALTEGNFTCVVAHNEQVVFTSQDRGVKPLIAFYRQNGDAFSGAAVADKVIGRAAALLVRLFGAGEVYGNTMSQGAVEELEKAGIKPSFGNRVEFIRNRDNTGLCPMEQLSQGVSDPQEMLARVEEFLARMAKN